MDLTPRQELEQAFLQSPEAIFDTAQSLHRRGDAKRKVDESGYQNYLIEAEHGYNQLLNRVIEGGANEVASPAMLLLLLGMMDQQRGWNGRAVALAKLAEAYVLEMPWQETPSLRKLLGQVIVLQGYGYRQEGFRSTSEDLFKKAVQISPDDPEILAGFAGLYINDGNPEKCIELLNRAEQITPGMKEEEHWNLALAHLELGHWKIGFDLYHKGIKGKERLNQNYWASGKTPGWDGSPGKTVVVYGEQGLGDEIMFASCLPEMIRTCKKVIYDCHPRLVELMRRSFPGMEIYGTRKIVLHEWAVNRTDIDAQIGIGSLPMFYREKDADFVQYTTGYLNASIDRVVALRQRLETLGPGPYIGIAWSGGSKKTRFDLRSIPLKLWEPILSQNARFISIHYMPEAAGVAAQFGIPHWQPEIDNMDDQAALVKACDLVITVNQTLVHLSGALAKKCWTLTPKRPAWRYGLSGSKMIWYPTITQFRQGKNEDWQHVINSIAGKLRGFIDSYNDIGAQGIARDISQMVVPPENPIRWPQKSA